MPGETAVGGNLRTTPVIIKAGESKANVEDTIEPTANGSIVTNNYTLSVDTHFEGCLCCVTTPYVSIPITIYQMNPINYGLI
jgi:hypothetical protein